jgi:hypothetical protein
VVITGQCYMPVGTITIRHDLTVALGFDRDPLK